MHRWRPLFLGAAILVVGAVLASTLDWSSGAIWLLGLAVALAAAGDFAITNALAAPRRDDEPARQRPGESTRDWEKRVWYALDTDHRNAAVAALHEYEGFANNMERIQSALQRPRWAEEYRLKWGPTIINLLREKVGPDTLLISGDWESCWARAVEAAARREHYAA